MKTRKIFDNMVYWLHVAQDPTLSAQFKERGNNQQKRYLRLAKRYLRKGTHDKLRDMVE